MAASIFPQIKDKTNTPTMKELNRYVINQYAVYWRDIGFELDLECSKIDNIEVNCSECEKRLYEVLKAWLQLNNNTTWKALEVAIVNAKRLKSGVGPIDDVDENPVPDPKVDAPSDNKTIPVPTVVQLYNDLCVNYERSRRGSSEEEWPPNQPSSIVNLALIHYQNIRTRQELISIIKRFKEGASHVDKLAASHSNVTTDIQKIFAPEHGNKPPKRILIEGAPGIGKTVLAKEIAYQWANGEILKECKLVFLLYLRDPKLHKVKSVNDILELFTAEITHDLNRYVTESYGINVAFVFDGFDEYPVALQKESFITNLIKGDTQKNDGKIFHYSTIIVTSRPTATLFLHRIVDRRIEILGFPKEERDKYILLSFKNSLDKKHELDKYLKQHPIINNLCYIPLHLAILMYLFQQDSLPKTLTEMNESFILNTIYRYLEKNNLSPPGVVERLKDFPKRIVKFVYKLSQLAFKGLQNNQLVFTLNKIRKIYPEINKTPGAINGFGLLQAVQHYPKKGAGRTTSVNFLHFTMQEYLAALHVSTLPNEEQLSLMEETFWDGQFNFMWMMYVGIVGVKSNAFASFIDSHYTYSYSQTVMYRNDAYFNSDEIMMYPTCILSDITSRHGEKYNTFYDDKRKCLHLFQCYMEAQSDAEMPKTISSIFTDGKITLGGITLLPHHIASLSFFMSTSSMQQWKILELGYCNLGDIGMNSLLEHMIKNDENMSTLEYVDLRGNHSPPWGVYCAIIRHCCVDSLTLCADDGMEAYVQELADSLQTNTILQSLTLCDIENISILIAISNVLVNNTVLKEFNASWRSEGAKITCGKLVASSSLGSRKLTLNKHPFTLFKENVNDIVRYLICGLHNVITQKLDISCNSINDVEAMVVMDSLKYNSVLKELDLSYNQISPRGMNKLCKCIKHNTSLEYVDLSGNNSSPWGVYCVIIKRCHVNSLTVCGDEGMKEYVKEITDSLQINTTLQSLTLCTSRSSMSTCNSMAKANTKGPQSVIVIDGEFVFNGMINCDDEDSNVRVVNIKVLYNSDCECLPGTINLSNKAINDDTVCLISFGLYNNTTVKKFDLSHNNISIKGMNILSECIKHPMPLEYVDLSGTNSSPWGVYCAIIRHCCVNSLTLFGDEGMKEYVQKIMDSLQTNTTLYSLTLYATSKSIVGRHKNMIVKANNTKRPCNVLVINRKLFFSALVNDGDKNTLNSNNREVNIKVLYDGDCLCLPETVNLANKNIDDDTVCLITFGLCSNTIVKQLDLSCNNISMNGMNRLFRCVKHAIPLEYVNLSGNYSSPWGVYCAIIRHCCVNSLTLCGDKGIEKYSKEITDSLQVNTTLQSLTICSSTSNVKRPWNSLVIEGKLFSSTLLDDGGNITLNTYRVVHVKILYDGDCEGLPGTINLSHKDINDDTVCFISLGLYNNTAVKKLDFSHNSISVNGMNKLSECIKHAIPLEYVDLSGNKSSPWGVYCAIVRHCCVNSLTLCGDEGMNEYVEKITDDLQINTTLQSLTLCNIGRIGLQSIKHVLDNNTTLKELNMSWKSKGKTIIYRQLTHNKFNGIKLDSDIHEGVVDINILYDGDHECSPEVINMSDEDIDDDAVYLISFGLYDNTIVQKLDLSRNSITNDGAAAISECLKTNNTLHELNLSDNRITSKGVKNIAETIQVNKGLRKLNMSQNAICDNGVIYISDSLKHNNTLLELNLSNSKITNEGAEIIAKAIQVNVTLKKLDLLHNCISDDRIIIINNYLKL